MMIVLKRKKTVKVKISLKMKIIIFPLLNKKKSSKQTMRLKSTAKMNKLGWARAQSRPRKLDCTDKVNQVWWMFLLDILAQKSQCQKFSLPHKKMWFKNCVKKVWVTFYTCCKLHTLQIAHYVDWVTLSQAHYRDWLTLSQLHLVWHFPLNQLI